MNVTQKVEKTFSIRNMTETQAQDLLQLCCEATEHLPQEIVGGTRSETVSAIRQALLGAGLQRAD